MAAYFLDLDGTLLEWGTFNWLEGALELLKDIKSKGHQIFFTTGRGIEEQQDHKVFSKNITEKFLIDNNIEYDGILWNVRSPRIIINDDGCRAINHYRNDPIIHEVE